MNNEIHKETQNNIQNRHIFVGVNKVIVNTPSPIVQKFNKIPD